MKQPHEDSPQKVPGPDPNVQPHEHFGLRYLDCSMCANLQTNEDVHGLLTYHCHSKGETIRSPHYKEICEGFLPRDKENMYIGRGGGM